MILGWIIPILVTIYLFILADKKMQPAYAIVNTPSLIFDKSSSGSKIKLLINDSLETTNNVYVTTLVFWNKGKLQINKEDVRQNFFINCTDSVSRIIDYKVLKEHSPINDNFKITRDNNILKIDWRYFDPGSGFEIQIIYSGTNQTKIQINGSLLGSEIREVKFKPKINDRDKTSLIIGLILSVVFIVGLWIAHLFFDKMAQSRSTLISFTIWYSAFVIALFIFGNDFFMGIQQPF
jgi:hypothetical protein